MSSDPERVARVARLRALGPAGLRAHVDRLLADRLLPDHHHLSDAELHQALDALAAAPRERRWARVTGGQLGDSFEWSEAPPPRRHGGVPTLSPSTMAALRARPGQWARREYASKGGAAGAARRFKLGRYGTGWEAEARMVGPRSVLWVRFIGTRVNVSAQRSHQ